MSGQYPLDILSSLAYSTYATMPQNQNHNSNLDRSQNLQNNHSTIPNNSDFYLDPTIYFDPTTFSHLPVNQEFPSYTTNTNTSSLPLPDNSDPPKRKTRLRAARACIQCRSRHMKCDSIEPSCTRCQSESKTCEYTRSRRGGLNRITLDENTVRTTQPQPQSQSQSHATGPKTWTRDNNADVFATMEARSLDSRSPESSRFETEEEPPTREKMIAKYYENFALSHPIVLPRGNLQKRIQSNPDSVRQLLPAMELLSSIYQPNLSSGPYILRAEAALAFDSSPLELPRTGFTVQAFVLLSMARHCSDDYMAGRRYLNFAIDVALEIGMHRRGFAVENGERDKVLEESWRRTWWMVYVLDANYAGMSGEETHRLRGIVEEVDLPCDAEEYESGKIPSVPRTIQEYDDREFLPTGNDNAFSSYTYFIDAARIFSKNLTYCSSGNTRAVERNITSADARYVNWFLYLPQCKQKMVKDDGSVDETMFSAVLFINSQKLLLHRPHSHLLYHAIEPQANTTPAANLLSRNPALHTAICMEALTATISLFALPRSSLKFNPIMAWALSLAILAQVSACIHILTPGSEEYIASRDRIKLGLGAMRASMNCWYSACKGVEEVMNVARALLAVGGGREESRSGSVGCDGSVRGEMEENA